MAVRKADTRTQEETSYVALEASHWAPEPHEGDYVHVWEGEGWGVWGALEERQLDQLPWPGALPLPKQTGNKGLDQVT